MARLAACEMQLQDSLLAQSKGLPSAVVMLQTNGRTMCDRGASEETGGGSAAARIAAVEAVETARSF